MDEKEPKSWWEIMDEDMKMDERIEELETENDMKELDEEKGGDNE